MIIRKDFFAVFILSAILSIGNLLHFCTTYLPLSYDNQILLSWQYSASLGQVPYRDIFYPYGLLSYYKGHTILFSAIYILLTPILFVIFFSLFKKIFSSSILPYFSIAFLFFFVQRFTGFEMFERYGIFIAFSCLLADALYSYSRTFPRKKILFFGMIAGFIFTLFNDQGIYSVGMFIFLFFVDLVLRKEINRKIDVISKIFMNGSLFFIGFVIGIIPFLFYLLYNHSISQFISSLFQLSELGQIVKVPFFHDFGSIDNIFTLVILLIAMSFVAYKFYIQERTSFITYLEIALIFSLFFLEQKNILRHIDNELTFISFLIFIVIAADILNGIKQLKKSMLPYYFFILFSCCLLVLKFHPAFERAEIVRCSDQFSIQNSKFLDIKKTLEQDPSFQGKILSFPGDTIFYILFHQMPPYYPTIYEGSSLVGQYTMIDYLKKQNVQYIIYDYKNLAIQDGVPNIIRVPILHQYILQNFIPYKKVNDFLILQKKKQNQEFFTSSVLDQILGFKQSLLSTDLANIPRSEGIYKSKYLQTGSAQIKAQGPIKEINNYLSQNMVYSKNLILSVMFQNQYRHNQKSSIIIKTKDGFTTIIQFNSCSVTSSCLIHLENLPLFYKNREIVHISGSENIHSLTFFSLQDPSYFW